MNKFDNSPRVIDSIKKSQPVIALKKLLIKKMSNMNSGIRQNQTKRWLGGSIPPDKEREKINQLRKNQTKKWTKKKNTSKKKGLLLFLFYSSLEFH